MTPEGALKWVEEKMMPYFPLGELKTPEKGRLGPASGRKHAE
jgi:hypothetical protein